MLVFPSDGGLFSLTRFLQALAQGIPAVVWPVVPTKPGSATVLLILARGEPLKGRTPSTRTTGVADESLSKKHLPAGALLIHR